MCGHMERMPKEFTPVKREPADIAAILYTSGTTGRPKGTMLSHSALASNANTLKEAWRFNSADTLIHTLPIHHTHGLFVATNVSLVAGASLLFFTRFDPEKILRAMPKATAMMAVPTIYSRLLSNPDLSAKIMPAMRLFVSGSSPLPEEIQNEWRKRTGHEILDRYGMTETNIISSNPYTGPRKPGTVGIPLKGTEVRIRKKKQFGERGVGILEVKGPGMFSGYWKNPGKTKEELGQDGFFSTGDLARIDTDGYIVLEGRAKDLVISGGLNVYPKEVETVINQVPGVIESAVIGSPHPDFGEGIVAVVVASADSGVDDASIESFLSNRLARYKHPKHIAIRQSLPRNTMGKVQKPRLREEFSNVFRGLKMPEPSTK